jgi:N-acetylmuramoyl-L-alanine amidase
MIGRARPSRAQFWRRGMLFLTASVLAVVLAAPAFAAQTITGVTANASAGQLTIGLVTADTAPLQVKSFELADPKRLVFDLSGAALAKEVPASLSATLAGIKQVRLGQFSADPAITRIVLDLTGEETPRWQVRRGEKAGETLIVIRAAGSVELGTPSLKREAGCVLLRLAGAGKLKRSVGVLDEPHRVYADLENASVEWYKADCDQAPLRAIRMGPQEPKDGQPVARVVLELREKQAHTVFADGTDLVIAVGPQPWALPLPDYAAAGRLKGKVIVVDPGHGGKDIGAPAVSSSPLSGPYEKNVVLELGQRLTALLKAEGASVTMTRDDDSYVALQDRAAIANKLDADALVSIHCNSCERPNTLCGTSVYYDHPHSAQFAALVQSELIAALGTADKGVRNANFAVIRRTTGPGVLVETAFINHDEDRQRLLNPNAQERAARAIVQGLIEYLRGATKGPSE